MEVLVMTSDGYLKAVRPFLYLFYKYWREVGGAKRPLVVVSGFSLPEFPLPSGTRFLSLGKQEDYPLNQWALAFRDSLNLIESDHVIVMLEDYWLTHPVNNVAVDHALWYMRGHDDILKFDLCGDRLYAKDADLNYARYGVLEIIKSKTGSPYHMSLMTGLWNKRLLLKLLDRMIAVMGDKLSPWDIELMGTEVLSENFPDMHVVGSHQWPIQHTLAIRGGESNKLLLSGLRVQDLNQMTSMGFFKPWGIG